MISEVIAAAVGGITVVLATFYFYLNFFIILCITTMISQIATAATVGGITMVWAYLTLKTFRICKQIVLPPPKVRTERCQHCSEFFSYYEGALKIRYDYNFYACKRCAQIEKIATSLISQSQFN